MVWLALQNERAQPLVAQIEPSPDHQAEIDPEEDG
jgi:hypothetical protein